MRRFVVAFGLILCCTATCRAQTTNLAVFQDLGVRCLAGAPDTLRAFRIAAPPLMPYLRPPLLTRWQAEGRTLYLADSTNAHTDLPLLSFSIEEAQVAYARARRRNVQRSVALTLRYTLTTADDRVLAEHRCRETYDDVVPRRAIAGLESTAFPETRATLPPAGWLRRYAEPALLTAATAVGVYLFFTLRSQAAANE